LSHVNVNVIQKKGPIGDEKSLNPKCQFRSIDFKRVTRMEQGQKNMYNFRCWGKLRCYSKLNNIFCEFLNKVVINAEPSNFLWNISLSSRGRKIVGKISIKSNMRMTNYSTFESLCTSVWSKSSILAMVLKASMLFLEYKTGLMVLASHRGSRVQTLKTTVNPSVSCNLNMGWYYKFCFRDESLSLKEFESSLVRATDRKLDNSTPGKVSVYKLISS